MLRYHYLTNSNNKSHKKWVTAFLNFVLALIFTSSISMVGVLQVLPQTSEGDVLFPNGSLDKNTYQKLAQNLSSEQTVSYRYGGDYYSYHPSSTEAFPTQCEREHKQFEIQPKTFFTYELGSPDPTKDDYSQTEGQFMHVADNAEDPGVYHFSSILMSKGMFSESPQKLWEFYGLINDLAVGDKNSLNDEGVDLNGGAIKKPVAMARGFSGWSQDAIILFNSGLIGTGGTYTGRTYKYFKFPPNKRPVGVAVTNNNEFALFTVWDTDTFKSQVAVVALAQGSYNSEGQSFWGDWTEVYPGLSNYGLYHFMKLLGYVDLPGIQAPTEISASSDFNLDQELPYAGWYAGHKQPEALTLSNEANRQTFIGDKFVDGTNIGAYAKAGFAVVSAPSEHKVAFIDLKPLFAYVEKMYFSTPDNFQKTKEPGQAPEQWPYTFELAPAFAPTVAQVVDFAARPTAVKASPRKDQAYVATVDGKLHIFNVGSLAGRHATTSSTDSATVQEGATRKSEI